MCGRYMLSGHQEFSERFQLRQIPEGLFPRFNAAPSQHLPVVLEGEPGERETRLLRWGLIPRWRKPGGGSTIAPINARSETLLEKPMFRSLVGKRRCLVPAHGFYEWRRIGTKKQPYHFHLPDHALFGFAGLWDDPPAGEEVGSFTIITTSANDLVAPLHDRMPVILRPEDEEAWLDPDLDEPRAALTLLHPYPADAMDAYPVSPAVNNARNEGPELIEPSAELTSLAMPKHSTSPQ